MPREVVPIFADQQAIADVDPEVRELVDLLEQRLRIDDHAVADDADHALVEDPRGNQVEHELSSADIDGVAGVVAALIARHNRKVRRHQVDDLALAFITPLRAENDDVHAVPQNTLK
jgi:hypothetical protein